VDGRRRNLARAGQPQEGKDKRDGDDATDYSGSAVRCELHTENGHFEAMH
jgi:hypothetical protein